MSLRNAIKSLGRKDVIVSTRATTVTKDLGSPTCSGFMEVGSNVQDARAEASSAKPTGEYKLIDEPVDVEAFEDAPNPSPNQDTVATRSRQRKKTKPVASRKRKYVASGFSSKKDKSVADSDEGSSEEGAGENLLPGSSTVIPSPAVCYELMDNLVSKQLDLDMGRDAAKLIDACAVHRFRSLLFDQLALSQLKSRSKELEKAQKEVVDLRARVAASESLVKKLEQDVLMSPAYEQELKSARDEMTRLQGQQKLDQARLVSMGEENAVYRKKLEAITAEVGMQRSRGDKLEAEVQQLRSNYGQVISQVIPHVCKQLATGAELNLLLARVIEKSRNDEKSGLLKELAEAGKIKLEDYPDYSDQTATELDAAYTELEEASFQYVNEVASRSGAKPDELLKMVASKIPEPDVVMDDQAVKDVAAEPQVNKDAASEAQVETAGGLTSG